jgi:hypothetical protein
VREESHLDDMRSAIRGDFERLAERRGGQELMHVVERPAPPDEPFAGGEPDVEASSAHEDDIGATLADENEVEAGSAHEDELDAIAEPEQLEKRSWLDRLLGR